MRVTNAVGQPTGVCHRLFSVAARQNLERWWRQLKLHGKGLYYILKLAGLCLAIKKLTLD